jgi:signal transduction histidine kinase
MASAGWSTQQLAEFVAAVSAATTEPAAALAAVERTAEALDAEVVAIVGGRRDPVAVGYADGTAPIADLEAVQPGGAVASLEVPGVGTCAAAAVELEHPPGSTLVIARSGPSLTREETGLLRAMGRVTSLTMWTQSLLDQERAAREELDGVAREQAALRRVATLVAQAASADALFATVAEEVARLSEAEIAKVLRYEPEGTATVVGGFGDPGQQLPVGARLSVEGDGVAVTVSKTRLPARAVRFSGPPGSVADAFARAGVQTGSGSPIVVEGRLWGAVIAARTRPEPLAAEAERRLEAFTELVATAIANAEARLELGAVAEEQAALRRVATLVAQGKPPSAVFAAVAEEVGRVVPAADVALVGRYDSEGALEFVGGWSADGDPSFVGTRVPLGGTNVSTIVFERNDPARVDYDADDATPATALAREWARSSAGAPINVEGRLWGVMVVGSLQPDGLPPGIEHELAGFTELVATAIANSQAREELRAIADEQAALRRVATLVASGTPPTDVFAAVAEEVGRLVQSDRAFVARYELDNAVMILAGWTDSGEALPVNVRFPIEEFSVSNLVRRSGRVVRIDAYPEGGSRPVVTRATVGAPITVEGRLWGLMAVGSKSGEPSPTGTEDRLTNFTELVALAIANAQAREELRAVAEEQAALRRVATLVAHGAPADAIFDAVTEEVHLLLESDETGLSRYDPDGLWTVLAVRGAMTDAIPVGFRLDPGPSMPGVAELLGGHSVRVDASPDGTAVDELIHAEELQAWVASPIVLMGRTWGQIAVFSRRGPLPAGTEERLGAFTELVATAIANAGTQAELVASRARTVATADETRYRIERDLHDGAQQRLVTLALKLRAAQASVPPELGGLAGELSSVAADMKGVLDELREFARGIHPAILSEAGLVPALKSLARRCAVPVELSVRVDDRPSQAIEVGAYYIVSEALANVAKHAEASVVSVVVTADADILRLGVRDDGVGGAGFARGGGLVGLKDRVEALGGSISVESPRGQGTSIEVELPLAGSAES